MNRREKPYEDDILWDDRNNLIGYNMPITNAAERMQVREAALLACSREELRESFALCCECFYLFRVIHRLTDSLPGLSVLAGDYFFSCFSHALIPIDSVPLTDFFSEYLRNDAQDEGTDFDMEQYLDFIRKAADVIAI